MPDNPSPAQARFFALPDHRAPGAASAATASAFAQAQFMNDVAALDAGPLAMEWLADAKGTPGRAVRTGAADGESAVAVAARCRSR